MVEKFSPELQFEPEPSRIEPQVQFEVQKISQTEPQVQFRVSLNYFGSNWFEPQDFQGPLRLKFL